MKKLSLKNILKESSLELNEVDMSIIKNFLVNVERYPIDKQNYIKNSLIARLFGHLKASGKEAHAKKAIEKSLSGYEQLAGMGAE